MNNDREQTDKPDEPGAENEGSQSADALPGQPADDDAEVGSTDQHSESDA